MDFLLQKVSYLQGLAEGMGVDESSNEGKLLIKIIDTLEEFADVLGDVVEDQIDLEEYVNFIDEDLADVEDEIYGSDDDDEEYDDFDFEEYVDCCDDEDCGCYCGPSEELEEE